MINFSKKIFFFTILGVIIYSCSTPASEDEVVTAKDVVNSKTLKSLQSNRSALENSLNPYNKEGREFYDFLNKISVLARNPAVSSEVINTTINSSKFNYKIGLNTAELNYYKSYFDNHDFTLDNLLVFQTNLLNDPANRTNALLRSVSLNAWSLLYFEEEGEINQPYCFDNCMVKKLKVVEKGNWIDKAAFILSTPESTAWLVASCAWDCRNA